MLNDTLLLHHFMVTEQPQQAPPQQQEQEPQQEQQQEPAPPQSAQPGPVLPMVDWPPLGVFAAIPVLDQELPLGAHDADDLLGGMDVWLPAAPGPGQQQAQQPEQQQAQQPADQPAQPPGPAALPPLPPPPGAPGAAVAPEHAQHEGHYSLLTVGGQQPVAGHGQFAGQALVVQGDAQVLGELTTQGLNQLSGEGACWSSACSPAQLGSAAVWQLRAGRSPAALPLALTCRRAGQGECAGAG